MLVIDNKKNVYDVCFFNNNGVEWSEEFFNTSDWNTVEVGDYIAYDCETDINTLIKYIDNFLNKEADFIDDETNVCNAFYYVQDMTTKFGFVVSLNTRVK